MKYGYARVSSRDQNLDRQIEQLKAAGIDERYIYLDKASGKDFDRKAFTLARSERYEGTLDAEGYGWFVVLPMGGTGTTLGLLDKFVGFTAVESICEQVGSLTAVLHESGTVGWLSEKEPKHVWANGVEVTAQVEHQGNLYVVDLPETSHKLVLTLLWE